VEQDVCGLTPAPGRAYAGHDESRQHRERDSRLGLCTSTAVHECRGPALSLSESAGPGSELFANLPTLGAAKSSVWTAMSIRCTDYSLG
jgi:hypothetical protein